MGEFLKNEKAQQIKFKTSSAWFSDAARADGVYKSRARTFCLPLEHAEENLFPGIRESAPAYFSAQGIKWHDGQDSKPSNHLCDSQVCCVNLLFPLASQPAALAELLRPIFPCIRKMLPMPHPEGQYVVFEWIGQKNYLNERIRPGGRRTRGANFTSADAAVKFEQTDGKQRIVLIEWKYTESYGGTSLKIAKSGTARTGIYRPLFDRDDCPIDKDLLPKLDTTGEPDFGSLFHEPFYQFMRQQFLAHEMERAHELEADKVSVLHVAPACNSDFQRVTSPELVAVGATALDIWKKLARPADGFISVSTEQVFGGLSVEQVPEMREWVEYLFGRYPWVRAKAAQHLGQGAFV
jgi:hypothetical protein